jgi:hypothetical protein
MPHLALDPVADRMSADSIDGRLLGLIDTRTRDRRQDFPVLAGSVIGRWTQTETLNEPTTVQGADCSPISLRTASMRS